MEPLPSTSKPPYALVIGARPGTRVPVPAGKTFVPVPPEAVETIGLLELVPAGDGTWRAVARICPREFKVTPLDLDRLKIPVSRMTLMRLITAGLVKGRKATPGLMVFDYASYEAYQTASADPEYWNRRESGHAFTNHERYQQAL